MFLHLRQPSLLIESLAGALVFKARCMLARLSDRTLQCFAPPGLLCCALVGVLEGDRIVGQLTIEAVADCRGVDELGGELGFASCESFDLGGSQLVVVLSSIEGDLGVAQLPLEADREPRRVCDNSVSNCAWRSASSVAAVVIADA